jgi:PAS domain S-box-containing protein
MTEGVQSLAVSVPEVGHWEWDIVGDRVVWSPSTRVLLEAGSTPRERVFDTSGAVITDIAGFLACVHPADRARVEAEVREAVAGTSRDFAVSHRLAPTADHPEDPERWVEGRARIVRDETGRALRMVGIVWDATSERRLRRERDHALRLLSSVRDALSRFISGADARGVFEALLATLVSVTESEFGFLGEVRRDADGNPWLYTRAITDIAWNDETRRILAERGPSAFEFRNLSTFFGEMLRTGRPVVSNDTASDPRAGGAPPGHPPLRAFLGVPFHQAGTFVGMVGLANRAGGYDLGLLPGLEPVLDACAAVVGAMRERDARELAERMLRESEERFRALTEQSDELTVIFDDRDHVRYASPSVSRLLALPSSSLVGEPLVAVVADDVPVLSRLLAEARATPGRSRVGAPLRVAHADGRVVELQATFIDLTHVPAVGGVVMTAHDVTAQRRAERERARLQAQVQHAQKLESLGVLAGGIAHDFNNLLVAIMGNVSLAQLELHPGHPAAAYLAEVELATQRAADLARQMLAYSGRGRFVVEPVDVSRLIEDMQHLLQVSVSKKAVLKLNLAAGLPLIEAEPTQLRQIAMNLVTNASEAIGDRSGIITITTGAMECDRSYLRESYLDDDLPEGVYVYIEVADTGVGMDAATREKIFDPFFTTKFAGRGLGLASVLGIIRGHRGAIKVYSELGRGTTIKALFPTNGKHQPRAAEARAAEPAERGEGTVLVVDDEETVRATTRRLLERGGYRVLTATDGRDALRVFRQHQDAVDVVLLDMTMPHLDGSECYRELRRIRGDVRVLLTSGYNEQEAVSKFAGKGLAGFLQKPFRMKELLEAVARAMKSEGA